MPGADNGGGGGGVEDDDGGSVLVTGDAVSFFAGLGRLGLFGMR